jgi:hypothetical protein
VETACGAALSLCYTQVIRDILPSLSESSDIVVIATGGSDIFLDDLDAFRRKYFNPPIVVKSGSEVFLKLGDSLSSIADVDTENAIGVGIATLESIRNDGDPGALDGFTRVMNSAKHYAYDQRNKADLFKQETHSNGDTHSIMTGSELSAALLHTIKQESGSSP